MNVTNQNTSSPTITNLTLTKLQIASKNGLFEEVQELINNGCDLDAGPDPALHLALRRGFSNVAILLLQSGADFELRDSKNDCAIHIASSLGLLDVVQVLCALGCSIEVINARGLYPLHLAARNGHTHIVRCLCAAGCNIDVRNADNIRADITALKYGHRDIAEMLDRMRHAGQRDQLARQLIPTNRPLSRLTLRLLGHCGVGKSALIKSLGAGLFTALFKRSSSLQSNKSRPSSPINTQIEMDVTSRQNSLTFEASAHYQSTKGIHIQQMDVSNVGDVTVWEFSGQETYFSMYHHFLFPHPHCITAILFSLEEAFDVQMQQVNFWLNFLLSRQPADLIPNEYGKIILIATHVDTTRSIKNSQGEWVSPDAQKILEYVIKTFPFLYNLHQNVIVLDSNVPAAYAFKQLKSILSTIKQEYMQQSVGMGSGLLESSLTWLVTLRKDKEYFPVLTRDQFSDLLRNQVNILASDEHINELLQHLHIFGEVFCVRELVVISVSWLCSQLLGELLSCQFISNARTTGVYSPDDFQATFNCCDSLDLLQLLEALHFCIQCDVEGEIEYEMPCYNKTETLPGLWDSNHPIYRMTGACYGGIKLCTSVGTKHLLSSVFPHIQIELRRATSQHLCSESDTDLYQWYQGSKLCTGALESLITLNTTESGKQSIDIKVRGPRDTSQSCFYFLSAIIEVIEQALAFICPGMLIERLAFSPLQLRLHCVEPYTYEPNIISEALLNAESTLDVSLNNPETGKQETIQQILLFDNEDLLSEIQWGISLPVYSLCGPTRARLCGLLDPPETRGCDWCLLAVRLGLTQDRIAQVDSSHSSHTMRLLNIADCTIGALVTNLQEIDRHDAAEVVLRAAPLFRLVGSPETNEVDP